MELCSHPFLRPPTIGCVFTGFGKTRTRLKPDGFGFGFSISDFSGFGSGSAKGFGFGFGFGQTRFDRPLCISLRVACFLILNINVSEYLPTGDPVKEAVEFYKDFVSSVELEYGAQSKEVIDFRKWYRDCKEHRVSLHELRSKVMWMFETQPKFILKFFQTVMPYLYPLATEDEVDRANQFINSVKLAFPNNRGLCCSVYISVWFFHEGLSTLQKMTAEVLKVLGNRDDLLEAYINFVPQAQNIKNTGKFFSYPVIASILAAFAIGLLKAKN